MNVPLRCLEPVFGTRRLAILTRVCTRTVNSLKMQSGDFSASVPFLKRPAKLDGTLAGDVGFDPLVGY